MPTINYNCEKCKRTYETENEAIVCENRHPVADSLFVSEVSNDNGVIIDKLFPETINVKSSNDELAFATYKLQFTHDGTDLV